MKVAAASRIFLVGFMGSGKTTFGKKLANKLGYAFVDLDELVVALAGQSIPEVFSERGEDHFRKLETQALQLLLERDGIVVATGGGTPCYFNNMEAMNAAGQTIYLQLNAKTLAGRLATSKTNRPLIAGMEGEELDRFVEQKLAEREQFYQLASTTVTASRDVMRNFIQEFGG